jgi:hypothetical protein
MMIRLVVFVVLMIFWLVSPAVVGPQYAAYTSALIPWACVAILGYEVYKGTPSR